MSRVKKINAQEAAPVAAESLADYIAAREGKKLDAGLVLVKVTHPAADHPVFSGKYGGIVLEQGPAACVWSDGSTE